MSDEYTQARSELRKIGMVERDYRLDQLQPRLFDEISAVILATDLFFSERLDVDFRVYVFFTRFHFAKAANLGDGVLNEIAKEALKDIFPEVSSDISVEIAVRLKETVEEEYSGSFAKYFGSN